MGLEIEAKMPLADPVALETKLKTLNAKRLGKVLETNTFFDTPKNKLKSADQGLRVRIEKNADGQTKATLTHKGPRAHGKLKSRAEHQTQVANARGIAEILLALGYQPSFSFQKVRTSYSLDDCRIEIDHLPYLGDYVEVEGPSDDAVLAVREKIGMHDAPLIQASYTAMLASYSRENALTGDVVKFDDAPALV